MNVAAPTRTRSHGLDLIRFSAIVAIVHFHMHETFFWVDRYMISPHQFIQSWLLPYSRFMAFSGFTIIALTSFLIGRGRSSRQKWLYLLFLMWVGLFCVASLEADRSHWFYFEWDIYPYLLVTFTAIVLLKPFQRLLHVLAVVSFALLCVPIWTAAAAWPIHGLLRDALIGNCHVGGGGGWPLLPWAGLAFLFFDLGRLSRTSTRFANFLERGSRWEIPVWTLLLAASIPWLGGYYQVPIGPDFNCFVFRRPLPVFWSHMIWMIFLGRLSLITQVNQWLARFRVTQWISKSYWSQHFGLCYALQFLWLEIGYPWVPYFLQHRQVQDLFLLSILPATEVMSRLVWRVAKRFEVWGTRPVTFKSRLIQ